MYVWIATFLTGLAEWALKKFSDKAYIVTVAATFSLFSVSTALYIAILFVPKVVPEPVTQALLIIAPPDWYAQLTIFIYIRAATFSFFQIRLMYLATANITYK